jgi:hypothetical protein
MTPSTERRVTWLGAATFCAAFWTGVVRWWLR